MENFSSKKNFQGENDSRTVPWFSMNEWKDVRDQIYSEDPEEQTRGCDSLRVWKARCSKLPSAVDCSLSLLHVQLLDTQSVLKCDPLSFEDPQHELSLMYCSAITRFLNQVLTNSDPKKPFEKSMSSLAKRVGIPEWMVQMRHTASHGTTLPAVGTLKLAAEFAMKWLYTNYWQREAESTWDWVPGSSGAAHHWHLAQLLDMWQSLQLFMRAGNSTVGQVSEVSLQNSLCAMFHGYRSSKPRAKELIPKKWKLKNAVKYIAEQIYLLIRDESHARKLMVNIISSPLFLCDAGVLQLFGVQCKEGATIETLPAGFAEPWEGFICVLHCANLLPELMRRLIAKSSAEEEPLTANMAALWMKLLSQSMLRLRYVQAVLIEQGATLKDKLNLAQYIQTDHLKSVKNSSPGQKRQRVELMKSGAVKEIGSRFPALGSAFKLPTSVMAPPSSTFLQLVRTTTELPVKWHLLFLPSLLTLVGDVVAPEAQSKLLRLTTIYVGAGDAAEAGPVAGAPRIHTVEELVGGARQTQPPQGDQDLEEAAGEDMAGWVQCAGEWQCSALGVLPWQQELRLTDLLLPSLWVPCRTAASHGDLAC